MSIKTPEALVTSSIAAPDPKQGHRGVTPSLPAQGRERRPPYINNGRDIHGWPDGEHTVMTRAGTLPSNLLIRIPYFVELDHKTLIEIGQTVRHRTFAAGETVLVEGKSCEGLYFVIRGQVRLVRGSTEGREHVLRVIGPGATFNDIAVFDGGLNSDGAMAVGTTTVGFIPKANITALIDRHPETAKAALRLLSSRQRALSSIIEDLALHDVTTRVARLLLGCLGHHEHIVEQAPDACARITHQEIASMVGSVREVVQRALKELEHDGAIVLERVRIRVCDQSKLKRWAHLGV